MSALCLGRRQGNGRPTVLEGARHGGLAGTCACRTFDGRKADPSRDQQVRKQKCAPSEHPGRAIVLSAPEPRKPCSGALTEPLGSPNPPQQSRRCPGQQADTHRLGDPDATRQRLFAVKRGCCLSCTFAAKPLAREVLLGGASVTCQPADDQTFDRPLVSHAQKKRDKIPCH